MSGRLDALESDPTSGTALSSESTARTNADAALSARLDTLEADPTTANALTAEASTRAAADTALSGRLDTLELDPTTGAALTAETNARIAADALKYDKAGGNISGEVTIATDKIVLSANGDASFAGNVSVGTTATADVHLANKKYVDEKIAAVVNNALLLSIHCLRLQMQCPMEMMFLHHSSIKFLTKQLQEQMLMPLKRLQESMLTTHCPVDWIPLADPTTGAALTAEATARANADSAEATGSC